MAWVHSSTQCTRAILHTCSTYYLQAPPSLPCTQTREHVYNKCKAEAKSHCRGKVCSFAGHRRRSGLIKQSLCVLVSLSTSKCSAQTHSLHSLLSQRADCVRERKERNTEARKIESVKAIVQVLGTNASFSKAGVARWA